MIIAHDSGGLFAYTSTCTHAGCDLSGSIDSSTGDVTCPCHGWQFDGTGACLTRSSKPLKHYALSVCSGKVYVDTSTTVASTTRTPA
jgi:nitrite reductase/ring-hydroxylating ferredoxin subunit